MPHSEKILGSVLEWGGTFGVEFVYFPFVCLGLPGFGSAAQLLRIAPQKRMGQMQETNFSLCIAMYDQ